MPRRVAMIAVGCEADKPSIVNNLHRVLTYGDQVIVGQHSHAPKTPQKQADDMMHIAMLLVNLRKAAGPFFDIKPRRAGR